MSPTAKNQVVQTLSSWKRHIRGQKNKGWIEEWEKETSARVAKLYQELGLKPLSRVKIMPEFTPQREVLGWLIAKSSEHGYFVDYYERFGHDKPDVLCQCGKRRAQLYSFCIQQLNRIGENYSTIGQKNSFCLTRYWECLKGSKSS